MRRWIMHVDMDAFFASVEQREHPEWRGLPVIVGGLSSRGVVATASYEARRFGVHSAMPIAQARRLCPDGIFVHGRFSRYREVSDAIHEIMLHYATEIEPISLDEAFMDISDMGFCYKSVNDIGRAIKKEILEETGLVASAGIAPNKFLAKMASDMEKPDGLCVIPYGREKEILAPLPVRSLWGVGGVTEKRLLAHGLRKIGDIQKLGRESMEQYFGMRLGGELYDLSVGIDNRPVKAPGDPKSIGEEETYETDLIELSDIQRNIARQSDVVAQRLRKKGLAARTVSLKIRFADFTTLTRAKTRPSATSLAEEIEETALALLQKIPIKQGVRLTGVTASGLAKEMETPSLFPGKHEKLQSVTRVVDEIREKFGKEAIQKGM